MTELFPGATGAGTVVTLPDGMPGFERCRRFVVVTSPTLDPFTCLQSVDGDKPSFLAVDPKSIVPDYQAQLGDAERARLDVQGGDALLWLAIVRFNADVAEVNLRAPIVINPRSMTGLQLVAAESPYSIAHAIPLD